jgi:hypothetical protein
MFNSVETELQALASQFSVKTSDVFSGASAQAVRTVDWVSASFNNAPPVTQHRWQVARDVDATITSNNAMAKINELLGREKFNDAADALIDYVSDTAARKQFEELDRFMDSLHFQVYILAAYKGPRGQAQIINVLGLTKMLSGVLPSRSKLAGSLHDVITQTKGLDEADLVLRYL